MSLCCNNPVSIGCFAQCADVHTGLIAPYTGTFNVHVQLFGTVTILNLELAEGEEIIIPGPLNENAVYKFVVYELDGDALAFDEVTCFKFSTYLASGANVLPPNCPDPGCADGREVTYLNYIKTMTLGGIGTHELMLVANFQCTDPGATMTIDWGDGSPVEALLPLTPLAHTTVNTPGHYFGTITCIGSGGNATLGFYYHLVDDGEVANTTNFRALSISANTDCANYPEYPILLQDTFGADSSLFSYYRIAVFGTQVYNNPTPDPTYNDEVNTVATDFDPSSGETLIQIGTAHGAVPATATITTNCITP